MESMQLVTNCVNDVYTPFRLLLYTGYLTQKQQHKLTLMNNVIPHTLDKCRYINVTYHYVLCMRVFLFSLSPMG